MCWMYLLYLDYSENKRVLSRRLKLSVLSAGSLRSSLSEFQAAELATENARRPYSTCWDCVAAQPGDDDWQNEDVVDWPHRRWESSSLPGTEEFSGGGSFKPITSPRHSPRYTTIIFPLGHPLFKQLRDKVSQSRPFILCHGTLS